MKISPHFSRSEFACRCGCGFDSVDIDLVAVLEQLRHEFNAPITVYSGCRCVRHNTNVGGAQNSLHTVSKASDIMIEGVDPRDVAGFLDAEYPDSLGIGNYKIFTHVDVRPTKARW